VSIGLERLSNKGFWEVMKHFLIGGLMAKTNKLGDFMKFLDIRSKKGFIYLAVFVTMLGGVIWFTEFGTIRGVPVSVVLKFLRDDTARKAYFSGDKQKLHDQLNRIGIEEEVKAFYRPNIQDEAELDLYIHQIFYDNTGYIGQAYDVNGAGLLAPKKVKDPIFEQWFRLAYKLGIVIGSREEAGVQYVIGPGGNLISYPQAANLFPLDTLKTMSNQH
jgi:hypothetical protein